MKSKDPSRVLYEIAQERVPQDVSLLPGVLAQIQKGNVISMKPKSKLLTAVILAVLVLVVVFFSLPGVVSAMKKLLGYIPGVGMVDQSTPLRVLAEPVTDTRDGFTVTVEKAVLDSEHTVIAYKVEGPFPALPEGPNGEPPASCMDTADLFLPDGSRLSAGEGGSSNMWASGAAWQFSYPAVPEDVNTAILIFPCLRLLPAETGLKNWEIALRFVPAPPEMTVYPVIDISTPSAPASAAQATVGTEAASSADGITLVMDRIVPLEDGYLLQATFDWQANPTIQRATIHPDAVHLFDASGREIALEHVNSDRPYSPDENHNIPLDYKSAGIYAPGPAKLVVSYADVDLPASATFTFDPGSNPQPEQTWSLNQDVEVNGYRLRVLSAQFTSSNDQDFLSFEMSSDSGISMAYLADVEHAVTGGGGGGGLSDSFSSGFGYSDGLPGGPITVTITGITVKRAGPWNVIWTPPARNSSVTPTVEPRVCLTSESWRRAIAQGERTLPAGLAGKLALTAISETSQGDEALFFDLKSGDRQVITPGRWPSLSPDGDQAVYGGPDGLYIVDLVSGQKRLLAGTTKDDMGALWSPDGKRIIFMRGPVLYDLFMIATDGSDLRQVTAGGESENVLSWMPDGNRILYTVNGPDGASLRMLDLQTNAVQPLFVISYSATSAAISPDGKRLAFSEQLFGGGYAIYVSGLDGSDRRLVSDAHPFIVTLPFWSPDGQWLAVSVRDPQDFGPNPASALIQPDTCQVISLLDLKGYVSSWGP